MTDDNDSVQTALQELTRLIQADHPELFKVMEQARQGEISEAEALGQLLALVNQAADTREALDQTFLRALVSLREEEAPADLMGVFDNGVGLPRMNPLLEAAILERIQFDEDIPELRTGPLPEGVNPAVPVLTTSRDPAVIGRMLRDASRQTLAEIRGHTANRLAELALDEGSGEGFETGLRPRRLLVPTFEELTPVEKLVWGSAETDLPAYRRGEIPAAIQVPHDNGAALAVLTPEERREDAWKFLSTTAGRRSALPVIRDLIHKGLLAVGLLVEINTGELDHHAEVASHREWTLRLAGPQSTQAASALLDMAAQALVKGLLINLPLGDRQVPLLLDVVEVNTVDVRQVGWGARLVRR